MAEVTTRAATRADLPRLVEIYNYYIINTPITFDLEPYTVETRTPWFDEHAEVGRHRMIVAVEDGLVIGYATSSRWRSKAAYNPTVEASIYCANEARGRGVGATMYRALFEALKSEDINRVVAGITVPNDSSIGLHKKFGFYEVGTFTEQGRKFGRYWDVTWMERPFKLAP